jgi:hypothetical protein
VYPGDITQTSGAALKGYFHEKLQGIENYKAPILFFLKVKLELFQRRCISFFSWPTNFLSKSRFLVPSYVSVMYFGSISPNKSIYAVLKGQSREKVGEIRL